MTVRIGTLVRDRTGKGQRGIVVPRTEEFPGGISVLLIDFAGWPGAIDTGNRASFDESWEVIEPESKVGRIVILADMEGVTGVPNVEAAVTPAEETGGVRTSAYAAACKAMTTSVQMAIAGARAGGAQEIIVADSHWYDTNLSDADFDVPVVRGSQAALRAMEGADGAMLIGWHAKAGTPRACLPHTYSDRIARLTIDGQEVGEIGMLTRLIASYGVRVILVSGDRAAHEEVRSEGIYTHTVVTKTVEDEGAVTHWSRSDGEIAASALDAIRVLAIEGRQENLLKHHPGQFEVMVQPDCQVPTHDEIVPIGANTYSIQADDIRASYAAFQRFVDRLPVAGVAPLAR